MQAGLFKKIKFFAVSPAAHFLFFFIFFMPKRNAQLHVEILIDDEPIIAKEFLFDLDNNDLIFKSENNQNLEGGFLPALLGSLLPIGIDIFSKLLDRGNGIYGNGLYGGEIPKKSELKKKKHDVKVFDKKTKQLLKRFKTNSLGGALITDPKFFKNILNLENEIKNEGQGLYAQGISANGVYGGQVGNYQFING